ETTKKIGHIKGDKGDKGSDGKNGESVKNPTIDEKGDLYVTVVDADGKETTKKIGHIKGDKGDTGAAGKDAKIKDIKKDKAGNTVIVFEDGKEVTVQKGDKGDK
ncbi:MAG: hypothetical protein N4R14_04170, partial [Lactobacillus iners]|nr:hypothetical protein [Lactobacillus iners]